jgi:hypothetical protein
MQKKRAMNAQAIRFKQFSRKAYSVFNSLHKVVNTGVVSSSVLLFANAGNDSIGSIRKGCAEFQPQGFDPDELQAFENELLLATPAIAIQASATVVPVQRTTLSDESSSMEFIQPKTSLLRPTGHDFPFTPQKLCPKIVGSHPIQDFFSETKDKLCPNRAFNY